MLCTSCQQKSTKLPTGNCGACGGITQHFPYRLCGICAEEMDKCEWCAVDLNAPATAAPAVQTKVSFVFLRDNDNGRTVKGLHVGEQVKVELTEDQYSGKEWDVNSYNRSCFKLISKGQFQAFPGDYQNGTRIFVFEVLSAGAGDIEFHEVRRTWSYFGSTGASQPVQGGQTWKGSFQIQ